MYYTVCYFTCIFYAIVRQISMLFIDNKDSVFWIAGPESRLFFWHFVSIFNPSCKPLVQIIGKYLAYYAKQRHPSVIAWRVCIPFLVYWDNNRLRPKFWKIPRITTIEILFQKWYNIDVFQHFPRNSVPSICLILFQVSKSLTYLFLCNGPIRSFAIVFCSLGHQFLLHFQVYFRSCLRETQSDYAIVWWLC